MRRKCLKLAGIGFLGGMLLGNLIAWFSGGTLVNGRMMAWTGSPSASVVIQTLLSGLLGAIAMGSVVVHEIESWSLLRSAVVHYLIIEVSYLITACVLGWYQGLTDLLIILGIQLAAYAIIWLIMYRIYKGKVQQLNELLEKNRGENTPRQPG